MKHDSWQELDDEQILQAMQTSVAVEQASLGDFLKGLLQVEERGLHFLLGYPNLFEFCHHEFGLSEGSIYRRLQVARKIRAFPELGEAIANGQLNLTLASLLCPHLGTLPWQELLTLVQGKSKREAQKLLIDAFGTELTGEGKTSDVRYTGRQSYSYRLKIPAALHHKLERVKEVLSHQVPDGEWENILDRMVEAYLDKHDPQRQQTPTIDFWSSYQSRNRYIPRGLKQKLLAAADFRCQFVSPEGNRCQQTRYLDVDHIHPIAMGGLTEWSNLQILCRAHNAWKGTQTNHNQLESFNFATETKSETPTLSKSLRDLWKNLQKKPTL